MNEREVQALYDEFLAADGDAVHLKTTPTDRAFAERPDAYISEDAFDRLVQQFRTWVGTRFMRRGKGIREVEVEVRVKIDGEVASVLTVPYTPRPILDGTHRAASERKKGTA